MLLARIPKSTHCSPIQVERIRTELSQNTVRAVANGLRHSPPHHSPITNDCCVAASTHKTGETVAIIEYTTSISHA